MEQPCALTTNVSQTSEKWESGSELVTSIGTVIGTLELRRDMSGVFGRCIVMPCCDGYEPLGPCTARAVHQ
jgi:hypothetical protein